MNRPTDWKDRLEVHDGKIFRVLKAIYEKKGVYAELDVYKEDEDGNSWERNLYQSYYAGNVVAFPGLPMNTNPYSYYYDKNPAVEEEWQQREKRSNVGWSKTNITQEEKGLVIMYHYDFKYVFNKYNFSSLQDVMNKLIVWKKHPEVEMVLAAGYEKLAMNNTFYKMTDKNKKKICKFCRDYPDACFLSLNEILRCLKSGNPGLYSEYLMLVSSWKRSDLTFNDYKYLAKKNLNNADGINLMYDYLRILDRSEHGNYDDFWRYPKDLQASHDRLLAEWQRKEEIRKAEEEAARKKEKKNQATKLKRVCKKYSKYNSEIDGYKIYFPDSYDDWDKQAKELHQCILYADYYGKMAERKLLIVFIRKDDIPIATAEIRPGKQLGQFYGNEEDRSNCKPSEEVTNIFNKWFENIEVKEAI